ncbi:MAG TPA: acyl-CoA dehydrogenase family protein [Acidimicrobiales bacterium]|nr:acyl-CoA dehydrogenase family protein [Acidimicrobiales bacterium]
MKLEWSAEDEAFRAELITFLSEYAPPEAKAGRDFTEGGGFEIPVWAREWQATLFDHGWMVPGYPPELGGRNATPVQTLIYMEELAKRRIPRSLHFPGYAIAAPSLLEFGNDEQKKLAAPSIRGDLVWCIGMSEPNAGSDLASLTTRAAQDGADGPFIVNGQKVWTSYSMVAEKCFCYVRTDPSVPKHKGISVLIIDMDTPGIEVRPLRHITGAEDFAEVFFTDVEVPAANLVGRLNDGWRITMGSLAHERGGLWLQSVAQAQQAVDDLCALARRCGRADDAGIRRRLAEAYEEVASLRALGYKGFASFAQGSSSPEHSYLKLATSELGKALYELGMQIQGPFGAVADPQHGDANGRWAHSFFVSFANTIAGGSSEIQRNIIATRILGLPR